MRETGRAPIASIRIRLSITGLLLVLSAVECGMGKDVSAHKESVYEKGRASFNSGAYDLAIAQFTLAIKSPEDECLAYANRARAFLRTGDIESAYGDANTSIACANHSLEEEKPSAHLYEQRAWCYIVLAEVLDAKHREGKGRSTGEQHQKTLHGALADLDKAIAIDPHRLRSLRLSAHVASQLNRWDVVISACDRILTEVPDDRECRESVANASLRVGDWHRTIAECNTLLENVQPSARVLTLRGAAFTTKGDFKSAVSDFERAMAIDPDDPAPHWGRASICFAEGEMSGALRDVELAVRLDPSSVNESTVVRDFFIAYGRNSPEGLIEPLDRICSIANKQGDCFLLRARAHFENGSLDKAWDDYRHAEQLGIASRSQTFFDAMSHWLRRRNESAGSQQLHDVAR